MERWKLREYLIAAVNPTYLPESSPLRTRQILLTWEQRVTRYHISQTFRGKIKKVRLVPFPSATPSHSVPREGSLGSLLVWLSFWSEHLKWLKCSVTQHGTLPPPAHYFSVRASAVMHISSWPAAEKSASYFIPGLQKNCYLSHLNDQRPGKRW